MGRLKAFCPHCGGIVPAGGRCRCGNRTARRKEREPWRRAYHDRDYQRNRQLAIERQHGRCKDCGTACAEWDGEKWRTAGMGGEVDHEVPLCEGGTNDAGNLALRCRHCHRKADATRRSRRSDRG